MGRYNYASEEIKMGKRRRKIEDVKGLLRTINMNDVKTFRDIRTNKFFTICKCVIGEGDVGIVVEDDDVLIVNESELMNNKVSPIADALALGTLYRTYEED